MQRLFALSFLTACVCMVACSQSNGGAKDQTEAEELNDGRLTTIRIDGVPLKVEVVQSDEERAKGLMYREELPEDQGMLFVFPVERRLSFWMRNTFIPLDIAFINTNGRVVDIQRMEPLDESKSYISDEPALYALEVNAGWFKRHALAEGSQVIF